HEAVFGDGDVELEQVAVAEAAVGRDAVNDFVVDADATDAGELVDGDRSGNGAILAHDVGTEIVEFFGGDAGADGGFHGFEHEAHDAAGFTHRGKFFGGMDGQTGNLSF